MLNDIYNNAKSHMEKTIESLRRDFSTLRSGKVSISILDNIRIDYYGTPTPLGKSHCLKILKKPFKRQTSV